MTDMNVDDLESQVDIVMIRDRWSPASISRFWTRYYQCEADSGDGARMLNRVLTGQISEDEFRQR